MPRAHVIISGLVQGVNYRYHTRKKALALGLTGFVRNRPDGTVEAVFEGKKTAIEAAIKWCRRGPRAARVGNVAVTWEESREESAGFVILR